MKKMSRKSFMRILALFMAVVMMMTSGAFSSGGWLRATGLMGEENVTPEDPAEQETPEVPENPETVELEIPASVEESGITYYDVTFVAAHTDEEIAKQSVKAEEAATFPNHKEYEGYRFEGWFDAKTDGEKVEDLSAINSDRTIYAYYAPISKFTITVEYKYSDGTMAKAPYVVEVEDGQSYSENVVSPIIEGFTADQETVVLENVTEEKNITVTYTGKTVTYTVEHLQETLDGSWEVKDTDNLNGEVGLKTAAIAKDYEGFTAESFENYVLAASGNKNIQIRYTRNTYTLTFDAAGGSYVEPVSYKFGETINYPENPTKTGFDFDGWKLESGSAPAAMPAQNITLTAQWKAVTKAAYTVVYWQEKVPGTYTPVNQELQYDYKETAAGSGNVGDQTSYVPKTYKGFSLNKSKSQSTTITADGQAVQNVYYDRDTYTIKFYLLNWWNDWVEDTSLRITAKYGADISKTWNDAKHSAYKWKNPETSNNRNTYYYSLMFDMPAENLVMHGEKQSTGQYIIYYTENLNGSFHLEQKYETSFGNLSDEDKAHIEGFTFKEWQKSNSDFRGKGEEDKKVYYKDSAWLKYTRNSYTVSFENCTGINNTTVKYEDVLSKADPKKAPTPPSGVDSDYIFDGWYTSPAFEEGTQVNWNDKMPAHNIQLFAKWKKPVYNVYFVENDGTDVEDLKNIEKYASIEEQLTQLDGSMKKENHTFTGWYTDSACTKKFVYTTQIIKDTTLYAGWVQSAGTVSYHVRYVDTAGKEVAATANGTGTVGSVVTENAISITGYIPQVTSQAVTLNANDQEITFVYDKVDTYVYTIRYQDEKGNTLASSDVVETNISKYVAEYKAIEGYVLKDAGKVQITMTPDKDGKAEAIFVYVPYTTGKITVKYMLQNVSGNGYSLAESYDVSGNTGISYTVPKENRADDRYDGFSLLTSGDRAATGTYTGTGSIIELRYNRQMFTVAFNSHGGTAVDSQSVRYEANAVRPADPERSGYVFDDWYTDETYTTKYVFSTSVTDDIMLHAKWNRDASGFKAEGFEVTYDGKAHQITFGGTLEAGESVLYRVDEGEWTSELSKFTDVCSHTVAVKVMSGETELWSTEVHAIIHPKEITVTGNTATKTYTGESQRVSGLTAVGLLSGHTISSRSASAARTAVGTTNMNLTKDTTYVIMNGVKDVTANYRVTAVTDGWIKITPATEEVIVTITGKSKTVAYNGAKQEVSGYEVTISNAAYTKEDFTFDGSAYVSGTDAGSYQMNLKAEDFKNINDNFSKVTFEIVDGGLTITPITDRIVVTITGNHDSKPYNGQKQGVSGYQTSIGNALYKEENIQFTGKAAAEGTDAGNYPMNLSAEQFSNKDTKNFTNVAFEVVDGSLEITPITSKVIVTITGNHARKPYNGEKQEVTDYQAGISNGLYKKENIRFTGKAAAEGTDAGTYWMNLSAEQFSNKDTKNFTNVVFEVTDGYLTITPIENVVVTIVGNHDTVNYNGQKQEVKGYKVTATDNPLYKETYIGFSGKATAEGTNAGTYPMGLKAANFSNTSSNFKNVTFNVTDGSLVINPVSDQVVVTIKENSAEYVYDGIEKKAEGYTVESIKVGNNDYTLYTENDFTFNGNALVTGTEVGTYEMELSEKDFVNKNDNFKNVEFKIVDGNLKITATEAAVVVTITENSGTAVYNGKPHTISGYTVDISDATGKYTEDDFTFSGTDSVTGTNAGTYPMELDASDFTNTNENFTNVTFQIVDGQLEISPVSTEVVVTIKENGAVFEYDGSEKEAKGYTVESIKAGGSDYALYTKDDFTFSGTDSVTGTNVGTYPMMLVPGNFTNNNKNFTNVKFVILDGELEITPLMAEVVVTITENSGEVTYTGKEQSVNGYKTATNNEKYGENDFTFKGKAVAAGTDAGTYDMEVKASDFVNNNQNFGNVKFVVNDGTLKIKKAELTVTTESASKAYDGTPLTAGGKVSGLVNAETLSFTVTGSQLYVGNSKNTYRLAWNQTAKAENYQVTDQLGTLTVADETILPEQPFDPETAVLKTHEDGKEYGLGEEILFTIRVTNIYAEERTITIEEQSDVVLGSASYKGTTINPKDGKITVEKVAPGETVTATAAYTVQEKDILAQSYENTVKVTIGDKPYEEKDQVTEPEINDPNPEFTVEKTVIGKDANEDGIYLEGEKIYYSIKVTNTGNVTLTNVVVEDKLTNDRWEIETLAPGKDATFTTKAYVVTEDDCKAGSVKNVATATGNGPEGKDPEETPGEVITPVKKPNPSMLIEKALTGVNGSTQIPTGYKAKLGDRLTYTITVTNNGNEDLTDIEIEDTLTNDRWKNISLAVEETKTFTTKEYVVTEADILAGEVKNVATVKGDSPEGTDPKDETEEVVETDDKNRAFTVKKNIVNAKELYIAGDTIAYEIIVKNTGNLTLEDIRVIDQLNGAAGTVRFTELAGGTLEEDNSVIIPALAPGEEVKLLCEYTVLEEDTGKMISNTAIADPKDPEDSQEPPVDPKEDKTDETPIDRRYKLTIHYVDQSGRTLAPDYVGELLRNEIITVPSPVIEGYTTRIASITTAPDGMPGRDLEFSVVYIQQEESPSSPGTPQGTEPQPQPETGAEPTAQPENDTAALETPVTEEPEDYAIVEDEQGNYILTPVAEIEVPLADIDLEEHACCILHFLLMLAAFILLTVHMRNQKKRQERVFELREKIELEKAEKGLGEGNFVPGEQAAARE